MLRAADLPPEPRRAPAIGRLLAHGGSAAQREKVLADFEAGCETDLAPARTMARLGPMLGLMGTLIPMGPALVGLAAGDIVAMAENLQVAFSTTVVGLFVGGTGFAVQQAKQDFTVVKNPGTAEMEIITQEHWRHLQTSNVIKSVFARRCAFGSA